MLENLNRQSFSELLHTSFRVLLPDSPPLPMELIEVADQASSPQMESFFLIFRAPMKPFCRQSIYHIDHDTLGKFELFLVPIGPDETGMRYQVIFNRFRKNS